MQPGTSGFDMGARFDGRSECSVCLKTFRDNHTLKQVGFLNILLSFHTTFQPEEGIT